MAERLDDEVEEGFVDVEVDAKNYPTKDYHYVYIGEIEKVLVK